MDAESVLAALSERPADPLRARQLFNGLPIVGISLLNRLEAIELAEKSARGGANSTVAVGGGRCSVCFEPYIDAPDVASDDGDLSVVSLPCRHLFHRRCLKPWFERYARLSLPYISHYEPALLAARPAPIVGLMLIHIA
jgi:hypothetical protein